MERFALDSAAKGTETRGRLLLHSRYSSHLDELKEIGDLHCKQKVIYNSDDDGEIS